MAAVFYKFKSTEENRVKKKKKSVDDTAKCTGVSDGNSQKESKTK